MRYGNGVSIETAGTAEEGYNLLEHRRKERHLQPPSPSNGALGPPTHASSGQSVETRKGMAKDIATAEARSSSPEISIQGTLGASRNAHNAVREYVWETGRTNSVM